MGGDPGREHGGLPGELLSYASFIVIAVFVVIDLFTAVVINNLEATRKEESAGQASPTGENATARLREIQRELSEVERALRSRNGASCAAALARHAEDSPVETIMRRQVLIADAADMLETVLARLQECDCHTLPVMQRRKLVGLITADNLGEFLMVQAALARKSVTPSLGPLQQRAARGSL